RPAVSRPLPLHDALPFLLSSPSSHGPNRSLLRSRCVTQDRAPWTIILRRYLLPRLLIPSSLVFPPVECSRGTSPSQAARSRALRSEEHTSELQSRETLVC